MLLQLVLDQPQREPGSVNGNIQLLNQIRHGADVILIGNIGKLVDSSEELMSVARKLDEDLEFFKL